MSEPSIPRSSSAPMLLRMNRSELPAEETGDTTPKEPGVKALLSNVFKVLGIVMSAVFQCALIGGGKTLEYAYIVFINNKLTRDVLKISNEGLPSQLLSLTISLLAYSIFFGLGYSFACAAVVYNTFVSFNAVFSSFSSINISGGVIGLATLAFPLVKGGDSEVAKLRKQVVDLEGQVDRLRNRLKPQGPKVKND